MTPYRTPLAVARPVPRWLERLARWLPTSWRCTRRWRGGVWLRTRLVDVCPGLVTWWHFEHGKRVRLPWFAKTIGREVWP